MPANDEIEVAHPILLKSEVLKDKAGDYDAVTPKSGFAVSDGIP